MSDRAIKWAFEEGSSRRIIEESLTELESSPLSAPLLIGKEKVSNCLERPRLSISAFGRNNLQFYTVVVLKT